MRLFKKYVFKTGTKIRYSDLPEIVHRFLENNHLTNRCFFYYFEDYGFRNKTLEEAFRTCGCGRILKDCPALGEARYYYDEDAQYGNKIWLTNRDKDEPFDEAIILPLMKKIHRRYGFSESELYYCDINFWDRRGPFERDYSWAEEWCKRTNTPLEVALAKGGSILSSGIELYRDFSGYSRLSLTIEILHDGEIFDATPYYESMQKLLPNIKSTDSITVYLTEEERESIADINKKAEPVLKECRSFLGEKLPRGLAQNNFPSNYSVAKPLKALAKRYGYAYRAVWSGGGICGLEKRTARGNVIFIEAESGPSRYNLGIGISYQGVGFKHDLLSTNQTPTNQQEADAWLETVIGVMDEFESALLPTLDELYPETPDWFIPSDLP